MITLSAFADEISPDPVRQIEVLQQCGVNYIELRSVDGVNVLSLSDEQVVHFHSLIQEAGIGISAIGSPIGKIRIDEAYEPHQLRFDRAVELAHRFGTKGIRVFSFYPAEGAVEADWPRYRDEVMIRMADLAIRAEDAGVILYHENEHRIYGDSPDRLEDLFNVVQSPAFKAAFDPANFVFCGYDPISGFEVSAPHLAHLHIKDWKAGEAHGSLAGEGDGCVEEIMRRVLASGYSGFATLEPHLLGGGPTGGVTGPDLFPSAVAAFRAILDRLGAAHC